MTYPKVKIYNPLTNDFTVTYDINGDNAPLSFTIHAGEIEEFDLPIANHIRKHLGKLIAQSIRGNGGFDEAFKKALKQIDVEGQDYGSELT